MYGLNQDGNVGYKTLNNVLVADKFIQSKAYPCLYSKIINGEDIYILIYDDDWVVAVKNKILKEHVLSLLKTHFEEKYLSSSDWK